MSTVVDDLRRQSTVILTEREIAMLRPFAEVQQTMANQVLREVGDVNYPMHVILSGGTEIVDRSDGGNIFIKANVPGEFDGELGLLTGQPALTACIVRVGGAVLTVPPAAVQEVIATIPELSDLLVTAFATRRQLLIQAAGATLTLIGPESAAAIECLQAFAARNRVPYRWLPPDDPMATAILARFGVGDGDAVRAVVRGQTLLTNPTLQQLARAIGLELVIPKDALTDLVVVGAGPAGLSAAVYAASEGLSTVVVDDLGIGGQAGASSRIENYLGFPTGISGGDLAFRAEVQAIKFGARLTVPSQAVSLDSATGRLNLRLDDQSTLSARSVVIASGAHYRQLGLPEQERFEGLGVYYAATELEARLCRDADVVVIGGGNSAGQAAMFLAETARTVQLICRGADLSASMSQYLIARLEHTPNVRIRTNTAVRALHGETRLVAATIADAAGRVEEIPACALFVMIGADPCTDWLRGTIELDDKGFILTGPDLCHGNAPRSLSPFQTSLPGVFAIGDVRSGSVKRVASAVGEGSVVVQAVHRYLAQTGR